MKIPLENVKTIADAMAINIVGLKSAQNVIHLPMISMEEMKEIVVLTIVNVMEYLIVFHKNVLIVIIHNIR